MNKFLICLVIVASTLICTAHSQRYVIASTDSLLKAAINNNGYTAVIVNYMTTTCSRSRYIKVT